MKSSPGLYPLSSYQGVRTQKVDNEKRCGQHAGSAGSSRAARRPSVPKLQLQSLQQRLAIRQTRRNEIYPLEFTVAQLEQDAKQAAAKITLLEETNRLLATILDKQ